MLLEYGIGKDAKSTGYYAGILEACIMLGSAVSVMVSLPHSQQTRLHTTILQAWTNLSESYGRRPILIYTTALTAGVGMTLGFPRSFVVLLVLRTLVGLLNGQCGTIKNYISEICDETNEAFAFSV